MTVALSQAEWKALRDQVCPRGTAPAGVVDRIVTTTDRGLSEADIHRGVVAHLKQRARTGVYWFHPANGEKRDPRTGARLVGLGVRPGVPDIWLLAGGLTYGLELKRVSGRLSDVQKRAHGEIELAGGTVATAYGLDAALEQLERWGLLR